MLLELFSILSMVVDTQTHAHNEIVYNLIDMHTQIVQVNWGTLNKISRLYQYNIQGCDIIY